MTSETTVLPGSDAPAVPAEVTSTTAAACCGATEQTTCCEQSEKSTCCGPAATAGGSCGCQ